MVQKRTQKSKKKEPIKKPLSKTGTQQTTVSVAPINGCGDSEESQNDKNMANNETIAGTSKNPLEKTEMDTDQTKTVKMNGEASAEAQSTSNAPKQQVKTQVAKIEEASTDKTSTIETGNTKSSRPVKKMKEKQKKEDQTKMETEEQPMEVNEEPSAGTSRSKKRKVPVASEPIENKQPKLADDEDDHTAHKEETDEGLNENADDEAVLENVSESIPKTSKTSNKNSAKTKKVESNKAIKKKRSATTVSKVKSKHQKVSLNIPSFKAVSGKVFVIGQNDVGQLGFEEEVEVKKRPAKLELPNSIADIAAGGMHSVCLTETGEVLTFGCNDEGALGRITADEESERRPQKVEIKERVVQISAGDSHSAALTESGKVYLWGNFRGGEGHMGLTADGAKQIKPIRILNDFKIIKISSGTDHLVCLSADGLVYTCGCGGNGQLGRVAERACQNGGRKGLSLLLEPALVSLTSRGRIVLIEDIWCGSYNTFFKAKETGAIYAFGLNNYNQLGYENENNRFIPKKIPSFSTKTWLQISGGQHHTLALDSNNIVHALGCDVYGRLGLGEGSGERSTPTVIPTLENEKCNNISCGNLSSFAVTENGSVYSWGMGSTHQLGHGNEDDCYLPKLIEGDFLNSWKALKVSGGGQHTLILASPKESANK